MDNDLNISQLGTIKIASEVVATIAGLAAIDVIGVAGMSGGVVDGIAELLRRKNLSKGVKASIVDQDAIIDMAIIVKYGENIDKVSKEIQKAVKKAVENMTGLSCSAVNINVQDITTPEIQNVISTKEE
jgi:uncharacterized alkaline shock family protein YloU